MSNMESLPQLEDSATAAERQSRHLQSVKPVGSVALVTECLPDVAVSSEEQLLFGD